jgi:AraC-like DNA-binding protein
VEYIEEGIADPNFTINTLESKMGMSHSNFFRKIKSLTGQSSQELLNSFRMKRAYQVLSENKNMRVSDVAYMVGFNSPRYFSNVFKKEYGIAPSKLTGGK